MPPRPRQLPEAGHEATVDVFGLRCAGPELTDVHRSRPVFLRARYG